MFKMVLGQKKGEKWLSFQTAPMARIKKKSDSDRSKGLKGEKKPKKGDKPKVKPKKPKKEGKGVKGKVKPAKKPRYPKDIFSQYKI